MRCTPRWILLALSLCGSLLPGQKVEVLDAGFHHLGDSRIESWQRVPADPEGLSLRLAFEQRRNAGEYCLLIAHHNVDDPWPILLNGKPIGRLVKGKQFADHLYLVPPGALVDGRNELFLRSLRKTDDIVLGNIRLVCSSRRQYLKLQPVEVLVRDPAQQPLPARITVTDPSGKRLEKVYHQPMAQLAVRDGVVYTAAGLARFELPAGDYLIHASRGMEWGMDRQPLRLDAGAPARVELTIAHEVDTTGFVACDTHIHTLTFSGHGDASVEERMVTLAGEGVELAIATDHNHQLDYAPYQARLGLSDHFKSVTGNEVTTSNGHFNAFPLPAGGAKPNHKLTDWVKLIDDIRAKGAKVVILNHPRWPQIPTGPFGKKHFELNRLSGARRRGPRFTFDAMELVNSGVEARDPLFNFVDWFALLNHGETITAVGSSDSHTVAHAVGEGRTYLRSATDVPRQIDVDEACQAFVRGYSSISQGLFTDVLVEGQHGLGSTVQLADDTFTVSFRIASASWCGADRARLFLNGRLVADRRIETVPGKPSDRRFSFQLDTPPNDAHLVCVASGPAVVGKFFNSRNPYVLGATNPVYLDVDADGVYRSPRHTAERLLQKYGQHAAGLLEPLAGVDDAVAVQVLADLPASVARALVEGLPGRPLLRTYAASLPGR